ncbi:hypothetical protein [Metabacillus sp. RGM 3146]|uniref:hypothetical protein n=1 Tax=Metabacillus sp. RGM 3146 TaxID=3401092 RepID=UPI003B9C9A34
MMDNLLENPNSYTICIEQNWGNDDQISFVEAAKAKKIDPGSLHFRVYENAEDLFKALANHTIDAAPLSLSEAVPYYFNGQVKLLGISSKDRIPGLMNIPTWEEQGIHTFFGHWRGIMGPHDITETQVKELDAIFEKWRKLQNGRHFHKNFI